MSIEKTKKIVVIGDGACGKTSLLIVYVNNEFPTEYIPTVFDSHLKEIELDAATDAAKPETVTLLLMDTSGQEDYERLRDLQYINTSVFVVCFATDNRNSFDNIRTIWWPEVRGFKLPIILVGTKSDNVGVVSRRDAEKMMRKIGALSYVECSAKRRIGVDRVFELAARAALDRSKLSKNGKTRCNLL